ncbi:Eco57I restriction-modification methylase domain-containing protein [Rubrivirga litoralis]|uniref:site-specific DNA-methyltransferase (adenine-specific) n=1 Tax=Rubrivirga litoralis TaxID=3075598 RepID=A0ABU3BPY1_9BACT|nr:N-6 DNA methylase [Rubrivirga sp. F394]MDT0631323.1 TaqI-like C-terminal specificity domain-containing protein [Rubrivirga sp. F394]
MPAPPVVVDLVERFDRNLASYRSGKYNETQVRREFLDPFYTALGWDVDNTAGYAEAYKDVVHEDAIKVAGSTKAPDYSFRVGGVRKFFLEAKKPSVNVKGDPHPAFQLRRYAWSAKLPLSILTDFEELAVYDGRVQPKKGDRASTARVLYIAHTEYLERWDEIAGLFSKEAVLRGSFDKYAESAKAKRGTAEVDSAFLREIEGWRERLAKNLALRNPGLSERDLNFAVQRTIDRLVFLRIAEDRGIEPYGELREATTGKGVYGRLVERFRAADARYNSGLFHFQDEKGREEHPDDLTPGLELDDKPLRDIIRGLYYPESPYEFSVLPADILGRVYEEFLGSAVVLTKTGRAEVQQKPEVKKVGGVYYTPSYVVDHIVKETVGRVLEGKSPDQVASVRVVDPACGSGTFLIGAYQYLLDWHLAHYRANDPEAWAKKRPARVYQGQDGTWHLTTDEKKRVLLNSVYGVDLDGQAVEVTKLSLLLKVLEGESAETVRQFALFGEERVLPDLSHNVKAGNALIGPDYYDGRPEALLDADAARSVNAFDWQAEFPAVFDRPRPGFDVVTGNPPYVRAESLKASKDYFQSHYDTFSGSADLFVYFVERSLDLLRDGGVYGVIVSSSILYSDYAQTLRRVMSERASLVHALDFGGLPVFRNAKDTYVTVPVLVKGGAAPETVDVAQVPALVPSDLQILTEGQWHEVPSGRFAPEHAGRWSLRPEPEMEAFDAIRSQGVKLGEHVSGIYRGVVTGANKVFVVDPETRDRMVSEDPRSDELLKPFVGGQDVRRYHLRPMSNYLVFTRRGTDIDAYPAIKSYLAEHKETLAPRPKDWNTARDGKWPGRKAGAYGWFEIQDTVDYYGVFERPKIMYPDIAKAPRFYLDTSGVYGTNTVYVLDSGDPYLLGILNSKLAWFCIGNLSIPFGVRDGRFRYRLFSQYMEALPIVDPGPDDPRRAQLAGIAEQLQALHGRLQSVQTASDKTLYTRQITTLDKQADRLVYEVYSLTPAEITAVEAAP